MGLSGQRVSATRQTSVLRSHACSPIAIGPPDRLLALIERPAVRRLLKHQGARFTANQ